jgi:hypothetical protein
MTPAASTTTIKTVGSITMLAGLAMFYLILGIGFPTALRYGLSSALLLAIPLVAFASYVLYLGYRLFARQSRQVFERIWFGATILVVVLVGRQLSSFAAYSSAAGIGLISVVGRSFVSKRLFLKHDDV